MGDLQLYRKLCIQKLTAKINVDELNRYVAGLTNTWQSSNLSTEYHNHCNHADI